MQTNKETHFKGEEMPSIVDKRVKYVGNLFHLSLKNQEASKLEGKMIADLKLECIAGEVKGLCVSTWTTASTTMATNPQYDCIRYPARWGKL